MKWFYYICNIKLRDMKNVILILVMMLGFNVFSQKRLFEVDHYPNVSTDTIPFADSLHTETFYNMNTYVRLVCLYINEERKNHGLNPLVMDPTLMKIAQNHSNKMAKTAIYKHSGLNYDEVITRLNTIEVCPHKENAGCAVGQWMGSQPHREALLDPNFKTFGIGVQENTSGFVILKGKRYEVVNNTYFTVIFDY
jgi:hypothetical protein